MTTAGNRPFRGMWKNVDEIVNEQLREINALRAMWGEESVQAPPGLSSGEEDQSTNPVEEPSLSEPRPVLIGPTWSLSRILPRTLDSGAQGAKSELRVAEDLMDWGYWVFRNMAPTGPVDLIAISWEGNVYFIEVTSGRKVGEQKRRIYNNHATRPLWTILAVCFEDRIEYYNRDGIQIEIAAG